MSLQYAALHQFLEFNKNSKEIEILKKSFYYQQSQNVVKSTRDARGLKQA